MSDRTNVLTTIIGAVTAVLGLVTALIVLAYTMGSSPQPPASTAPAPTATLVAATSSQTPSAGPTNASASPSGGPTPTAEPSPSPSVSASSSPTASVPPSPAPTPSPTAEPTPTPEPTPPPTAEPTPRPILFYSVREDPESKAANADIYWVDPETSVERRLTMNFEPDSDPAWSPDGIEITFDSRLDGNTRDIWIIRADGELVRITNDEEDDAFPVFSPDAAQVAWSRGEGSSREIWVASAEDGSNAHAVTAGADDRAPSWSSRGFIAFQRRVASGWEIWVVEPDVTGPVVRISTADGGGSSPAWSPDGRRISFVRPKDGLNRIFTVAADGTSDLVEVTRGVECDCEFPTWSPDGRQIAFVGPRGTTRGIYVIGADGGTPRRVTSNGLVPSWGD